jgi:glycosyltransferase involved in cell wall biosynthesis
MPELSIAVPCYNEAGNIRALVARYRPASLEVDLELILVDNGSTDGTAAASAEARADPANRFAKSVRVERNRGYGRGLQAGLTAAAAPVLAISHADLQCPPEDVLRAYRLYQRERPAGPCLVKGRRGGRPFGDRLVTWCYNRAAGLTLGLRAADEAGRTRLPDVNAEPKVFDRALAPGWAMAPKDFTFDLWLLHRARLGGARILEFDVAYLDRSWGKSKLAANPWMRLTTALNSLRRIAQMRLGKL